MVERLRGWALVREQELGELPGDSHMVLRVDAVHVEALHHDSVELEAFPMLSGALTEAICEWWASATRKPEWTLVLELAGSSWSIQQLAPGVLEPESLREIFGFLAGTTETRWGSEGPRATNRLTRAIWTDFTEDVRLTFEREKRIEVREAGPYGSPNWLPSRHRPERVTFMEQKADGVEITYEVEQVAGDHPGGWDRPIWLPLPAATISGNLPG